MIELKDEKKRFETVSRVMDPLLKTLKQSLGENLVCVVLYGSSARGQMGPESDVDILIVAEGLSPSSLERQVFFTQILNEVEASLKETVKQEDWVPYISATLKTPKEAVHISRIYFDMIEEAKILYDRKDFFKGVLRKVKARLEELGAKRIQVGKMWYWDLKPDYRPGEIFEL